MNVDVEVISAQQLRTRMAEDLVPADQHNAWYPQMGMVPGSDEGALMEKAAGDARRGALRQLGASVDLFTEIASDLMQRSILLHGGHAAEEEVLVPLSSLTLSNLAVTKSVLAQLIDLGIVTVRSYTVEGTME